MVRVRRLRLARRDRRPGRYHALVQPPSTTSTSTLTVTTTATAQQGNYTLTITGTNGSLSHIATVTLSVRKR